MSKSANRDLPDFDHEIVNLVDYVCSNQPHTDLAYKTSACCLMDTLGCALLALQYPDCTKLLGPLVPGAELKQGARVPGTAYVLEPVQATFNFGAMLRWLDYNDTWLAAEWGHPSDNLAGILMVADYLNQQRLAQGSPPLLMQDVLDAMIKAYEIQGVMALSNAFNRIGLDHVVYVKLATVAVVTHLLGGTPAQIANAISLVWVDGQSLRTYRHAPNVGSRKSWAAGDASSRGVRLALMAMQGEMGYPNALTAPSWGVYAVYFNDNPFALPQPYTSYVMENILYKVAFPAEFHGQTAVECALQLRENLNLDDIAEIHVETQDSAMRIINKSGSLNNPSDRDHSLQYMIAIALLYGHLTADHYQDKVAQDPRIDQLCEKMIVAENHQFSRDYLDPQKRSIANAIQIKLTDGSNTKRVQIDYPLGHRQRREEALPLLEAKFRKNVSESLTGARCEELTTLFNDYQKLAAMPVNDFMQYFIG